MNGKGDLTFTNGNRYVGEWRDSKINGYGEFYWENGDVYKG